MKYPFIAFFIFALATSAIAQDQTPAEKTYRTVSEELGPKELKTFMKNYARTMRYPANARRMGTEGEVKVEFAVNPDGTLSDFKVIEGVADDLDEEALRTIKIIAPQSTWKREDKIRWVLLPARFKLG